MSKPIRILSIDGGGTRGLFPATILASLEKELKEKGALQEGEGIVKYFDIVVGSATGGIIASALAAGMSAEAISKIYLHRAKYILPQNFLRRIWNFLNIFAPKYRNENLKKLLQTEFGASRTLGNIDAEVRQKYANAPVFLFPALELNPEPPKFINDEERHKHINAFKIVIYNNVDHPNELLVDVAMKTSAAIMNLPIYDGFVEGGNFANDPALAGFFYALKMQRQNGETPNPDAIQMLSLGCGSDEKSYIPTEKIGKGNWGLGKWINHLTPMVIETKMVATQYYLKQALPDDQYYRINVCYNAAHAPSALRGKKLAIDVRKDAQLRAIHEYAYLTYLAEKDKLNKFIGLV